MLFLSQGRLGAQREEKREYYDLSVCSEALTSAGSGGENKFSLIYGFGLHTYPLSKAGTNCKADVLLLLIKPATLVGHRLSPITTGNPQEDST
jgi:hypothetical protein